MSANDYFSHESKKGETVKERVEKEGYPLRFVGENIALGQETPGAVVRDWLNSPAHCSNIMNPNYAEVGASLISREKPAEKNIKGNYWVVVFGKKKN
ncbi:MAG: CAP domain-containing protein [Nitrospirae bacterium YQR-1]